MVMLKVTLVLQQPQQAVDRWSRGYWMGNGSHLGDIGLTARVLAGEERLGWEYVDAAPHSQRDTPPVWTEPYRPGFIDNRLVSLRAQPSSAQARLATS